MHNLLTLLVATSATLVHAGITQDEFTGIGHIYVLESDDWQTATLNSTVGCLNDHGKFVANANKEHCGVFSRLDTFPYTLSTTVGNCTFNDVSQETNSDSHYGKMDYAWNCNPTYKATIYDEFYTIVSTNAARYDIAVLTLPRTASLMPSSASVTLHAIMTASTYPKTTRSCRFGSIIGVLSRWASHLGMSFLRVLYETCTNFHPPRHIQLQLMWSKIRDLPGRGERSSIPGPRMQLAPDMQVPLQGQISRS